MVETDPDTFAGDFLDICFLFLTAVFYAYKSIHKHE